MERCKKWVWLVVLTSALAAAGCGTGVATPHEGNEGNEGQAVAPAVHAEVQRVARDLFQTPASGLAWQVFRLPGKRYVPFESIAGGERPALQVRAHGSVSVLRQRFSPAVPVVGQMSFSWRVDGLPPGADLKDAASTDAPVRILLAFEGDRSNWSPRTHRLSELSRLLTGEELPYATLSYVWSVDDPAGAVLSNPRTDRIRKLVVESGATHLGQWREYRRDVRADFRRAFGEEPGPLVAVALMTDTDNTGSSLQAWYGAMRLEEPAVAAPAALH